MSAPFNHQSETPEVFAREAQVKLEAGDGFLLVDVREPWEYAAAHVPGAVLIPLGEFVSRFGELPREQELLVICHSGYRSYQAATFLLRQGYPKVANVVGGMEEWEAAGLPVERGAGSR